MAYFLLGLALWLGDLFDLEGGQWFGVQCGGGALGSGMYISDLRLVVAWKWSYVDPRDGRL